MPGGDGALTDERAMTAASRDAGRTMAGLS
jgi:hypothetical protein